MISRDNFTSFFQYDFESDETDQMLWIYYGRE